MVLDPTPTILGLLLYLALVIGAMVYFVNTMRGRVGLLLKAQPEDKFNRWVDRTKHMLLYAMGQKRIIKGDLGPGILHAFIFWGFCAVALNTTHLMVRGVFAGFHFPFLGPDSPIGALYALFRDVFEVIVLVMVVISMYRRAVVKPKRLTQSGEAQLILAFIGILMVTDFFLSGAEAAAHTPAYNFSPVQAVFAGIMGGFGETGIKVIYVLNYWIHMVVLYIFMNLLPLGKHFHVITSLPSVFFAHLDDEGPIGTLSKLDLEDEEAESFGLTKIEEFTWKQDMDLYSCTECGRCQEFCPAHMTDKPLSPKKIITSYRDHLYEKQPYILGQMGEKEWEGAELTSEEVVSEDVVWSCTTCHYCEEACPLFIEHIDKLEGQRRNLVLMEASFPQELMPVFKGLENNSNPWGIGASTRGDWTDGLDVPLLSENPDAEYLYYVGCAGSFDERNKSVSVALVKLLKLAGVSFAILGEEEQCCGDQARRLGNEYLFQMMAETNVEIFKEYGVKKIVTACPHGYNVFKNEYPQFGAEFEVIHHTELIGQLIKQGKLTPQVSLSEKVAYHDSCYLGRYNEIYDAPREILSSIPGLQIAEPEMSNERGFCCGAGGGRMWLEENLGSRINQMRVDQLADTKANVFSSACPFCLTMLSDGIKETNREEQLKVKDIAEMVLDALPEEKAEAPDAEAEA